MSPPRMFEIPLDIDEISNTSSSLSSKFINKTLFAPDIPASPTAIKIAHIKNWKKLVLKNNPTRERVIITEPMHTLNFGDFICKQSKRNFKNYITYTGY